MLCFHVERFCLSCHGDALWADTSGGNRLCWLVLLLHVCMCPCAAHTNTHTETNVQYGAFEEWSLLTEPQHQPVKNIAIPKKTVRPHPEDFKGVERHVYKTLGTARLLSPPQQHGEAFNLSQQVTGWTRRDSRRVFIANNYHIHCSHQSQWAQSAGCKREHRDIPLDNHFTLFKCCVYCLIFIFFLHRLFFKFWELDHLLFEAKFSHVLMSAWSLFDCYDFFVLCLIFTDDQVTGLFFLSLMLIIFHAWNLVLCRLVKIKQCQKIFNLKENVCAY